MQKNIPLEVAEADGKSRWLIYNGVEIRWTQTKAR
jgi:hypothetical protein